MSCVRSTSLKKDRLKGKEKVLLYALELIGKHTLVAVAYINCQSIISSRDHKYSQPF